MAECHITGPLVLPVGMPAAIRSVVFRRVDGNLTALADGAVVPDEVRIRTDAAGLIDVTLLPGTYSVSVPQAQGAAGALINVPDVAAADFASLLVNGAIPDAKPGWFDAALADATVAVEFPVGDPGQVLGYGDDGKVKPVAAGGYDDAPIKARLQTLEDAPPTGYDDTAISDRVAVVETALDGLPAPFDPAPLTSRLTDIEAAVDAIPAPYDDAALAGRVSGLETAVADIPAPFDPAPLTGRVAALESAPAPDLTPIQSDIADIMVRLQALESGTPPVQTAPAFTTQPSLMGSTALGSTITIGLGAASGVPSPTLTGTLTRPGKADATVTDGATFQIEAGDQGGTVTLTATASNTAGNTTATATMAVPAATGEPAVVSLWIGQHDTQSVMASVIADAASSLVLSAEPVGGGAAITSPAATFDPTYGFARATVTGLAPDTQYQIVPVVDGARGLSKAGTFRTRPDTRKAFRFGFASCAQTKVDSSTLAFTAIRNLIGSEPFHWCGDRGYRDIAVNDVAEFHSYERVLIDNAVRGGFHRNGPVLYNWDDHDFAANDSGGYSIPRPAALAWYRGYVPHDPVAATSTSPVHWETMLAPGFHLLALDARSHKKDIAQNFLGTDQEAWLIGRIQTIGADPQAVLALNVAIPWISSSDNDTWHGAAPQRQRIMDAIATHMPGRAFIMAGDAHMLAFDDGTNNAGVPVYQAAPIEMANTVKGGPYSGGTVIATKNQFATIDATPTASGWTVTYKGYSMDTGGALTQRLIHTTTLEAPDVTPDSAPVITADPVLNGSGEVGSSLTVTTAAVTGKPTPTETVVMLRDGVQSPDAFPYVVLEADATSGVTFTAQHRATNGIGTDAVRVSNPVNATAAAPSGGGVADFIAYANTLSPQFGLVEKSGTTWLDASGNGRNGTITGAEGTHTLTGPLGLPFLCGTPSAYAVIPHDPAFIATDWTMVMFVRVETHTTSAGIYNRGANEGIVMTSTAGGAPVSGHIDQQGQYLPPGRGRMELRRNDVRRRRQDGLLRRHGDKNHHIGGITNRRRHRSGDGRCDLQRTQDRHHRGQDKQHCGCRPVEVRPGADASRTTDPARQAISIIRKTHGIRSRP